MRDDWYYSFSGEERGPLTLQELMELLPALVRDGALVWHQSFADQMPANEVAALVAEGRHLSSTTEPSTQARLMSAKPSQLMNVAIDSEFYCSVVGFVLGALIIVVGCVMSYLGVTGAEPWGDGALAISSLSAHVAPGAVLIIVGALLILVTR